VDGVQAPRVERGCDACGQVDDHPRHVRYDPASGNDQIRHLDCCAQAGCPDGSCPEILARVGDVRGASLISALTGGN